MKIKSFPVLLKQLIFSTYLDLMAVLETDGVKQGKGHQNASQLHLWLRWYNLIFITTCSGAFGCNWKHFVIKMKNYKVRSQQMTSQENSWTLAICGSSPVQFQLMVESRSAVSTISRVKSYNLIWSNWWQKDPSVNLLPPVLQRKQLLQLDGQ